MDAFGKKKAVNLIKSINDANDARRQRMRQADASRIGELAEWEGSERIRAQIPNLHASPNKMNTQVSSISPTERNITERLRHAKTMRDTMKKRQDLISTSTQDTTNHAAALQALSNKVQTNTDYRESYQTQPRHTAPTSSSPYSTSSSPSKRQPHMRVASQQWQSPGRVQEVHARLDTIEGIHSSDQGDTPLIIGPDEGHELVMKEFAKGVNHDLIAKTYAFARAQQEETERLRLIALKDQVVKVPRKLFSKLRGFLDKKRDTAFKEVVGLLSLWLPSSYESPSDAVVSSIASTKVKTDFQRRFTDNTTSPPPFYSVVRLDDINHENSLDELLSRNGTFYCPPAMSMVFPVGRMGLLEPGVQVSLLICKVHPGISYWMDEHDMPGLTRDNSHVYLPSGPPDDFDSICLLGRRTKTDANTGKRRSSLDGVGDPIDPLNEYYRYLIQEPSDRAIAMWCVTFTPKLRNDSASMIDMTSSSKNDLEEKNDTAYNAFTKMAREQMEHDNIKLGKGHGGSPRWEQRARKKDFLSNSPHKTTFDMSAVVEAARQKEASRISSWQDPIESGKADTALEEFEAQCDEYTRALQSKLVRLHQQLEDVHRNYMSVQNEIHDELRSSLTDVQLEKKTRKGALRAWKLQLLQTNSETSRMDVSTKSEWSVHRVYGSTVVSISMTPPSFKPVSLPLPRFFFYSIYSKTLKQVFYQHSFSYYKIYFFFHV